MNFDVIAVGGGLAGSALAIQLARSGYRVLVLEQERQFKDRVRGENMLPWGVAAARRLGIIDDLVAAGGHQPNRWITYVMGNPFNDRDLRLTTPHGEASLNIYHPDMQEALLRRASAIGVEVRRGAKVVGVDCGPDRAPAVMFDYEGERRTERARLVVGADGRDSQVRRWAGFESHKDQPMLMIAGVLFEGTIVPEDAVHLVFGAGCATLTAPLGRGRARVYYVYPEAAVRLSLSGADKVPQFLQLCRAAGAPEAWFAGAESAGPLAEFAGADRWVQSPAGNGVTLVGDAAASTDPSWGCGLSLTLLDVEHLANALRQSDDWTKALDRYAREHDEYYAALHRILGWMTELIWTPGPSADQRRRSVFPRMITDPEGFPDSIGLGPFGPSDERARRLVLGLE